MRANVQLRLSDDGIVLQLTSTQRNAVMTAASVASELRVPDLAIELRFAAPRQALADVASRFGDSDLIIVTTAELQIVYQLFRSLPDCFSSEEDFYTRTGYFKENFIGLSRGLLDSMARVSR